MHEQLTEVLPATILSLTHTEAYRLLSPQYNSKGELKICDMGMSRQYGSPLRTYTHLVVTLW